MRIVMIIALASFAAACGSGGSSGTTYHPSASHQALSNAGWSVTATPGMKPISGGRQLGWFNVTAPDGTKLSLQFLENPDHASQELSAVQKSDPKFQGKTVGSILAFLAPNGHEPIPSSDLKALARSLK